MKSNYVIWANLGHAGHCELAGMKGYEEDWNLLYGNPVAKKLFPKNVQFPIAKMGKGLTDNLDNIDRQIVASEKLVNVVKEFNIEGVEFLPVSIVDKKNKKVSQVYQLIHPINPVDCLNVKACKPEWDVVDENSIEEVKKLVINETKIDSKRLLFRPKQYFKVILAHRSLAEKMDAAGITGIRWVELSDWPEE
jgi:hypothetical protein